MAITVLCPHCFAENLVGTATCSGCGRSLAGAPAPAASATKLPPAPDLQSKHEHFQRELEGLDAAIARVERQLARAKRKEERERRLRELEEIHANREALLAQSATTEWALGIAAPAPASEPARQPEDQAPAPPALLGAHEDVARVPTHVRGLDEALGGGIPAGSVVVLGGAPGTMKSSLAFWILSQNGQRERRRGLYVTYEESTGSLLRQMAGLGVDLARTSEHVKFLDGPTLKKSLRGKADGDWLSGIRPLVEGKDGPRADLLVLDSLDALSALARFRDHRQEVFRLFEWLRGLGLTALVIVERPDYLIQGNVLLGRYDEDFLADGVLHLRLHLISDQEAQRRIRVVKMRGTRHETGYLALHVGAGDLEVGRVLSG